MVRAFAHGGVDVARTADDDQVGEAELQQLGPRTDHDEGPDIHGLRVEASDSPRLARRLDSPSYPLRFGAHGDGYLVAEPGADVYDVRTRAKYVDRDLRLSFYRQPAYAALETLDIDGIAAQVGLEFSEQRLESARGGRFDPDQFQRRVAPADTDVRAPSRDVM